MLINLLRFCEGDLAQIMALDQQCFNDPWSSQQWRNYLINPKRYAVFGLVQKDQPICFSIFSFLFDEAELLRIGVIPEYRGVGIAETAMTLAESQLIDLGLVKVMLEVRESNVSAIRLYEKRQFMLDGRRKNYYPAIANLPAEDALLMSKLLIQE